jgi:beta-galactosidase
MEQNARGIRVGNRTHAKSADRMVRNSLGYIARGSQSSLFFQWRGGAGGSEQWHGALVPHGGGESPLFESVVELGRILEAIGEVADPPADGRVLDAEVGIVWHADGWWALETPHLPNDAVTYSDEVRATHRSFWRAGIATDFVRPGGDASRYRLLVVPALYAMPAETIEWLRQYVEDGGRLVVSTPTGIVDEHQRITAAMGPSPLGEFLGVSIDEVLPLAPGTTAALDDGSRAEEWTERMRLVDAQALAAYAEGPLAGAPAITHASRGDGSAVYISARLEQASRDAFLARQADEAGVTPVAPGTIELGIEVIRRRGASADYLFVLHHGDQDATLSAEGHELVSDVDASDGVRVVAGGVAVVRVDRGAGIRISGSDAKEAGAVSE